MGDPYGTFPSSVNVSANPQTVVANNLYADNVGFGIFSAQTGVFSSLVADNITVTGITSSLLNIDEINLNTLDATGACILYLDTQVLTGIAIQAEQAVIQSLVSDQITAQTIISSTGLFGAIQGDSVVVSGSAVMDNLIVHNSLVANQITSDNVSSQVLQAGILTGNSLTLETLEAGEIDTETLSTTNLEGSGTSTISYLNVQVLTGGAAYFDSVYLQDINTDVIQTNILSVDQLSVSSGASNDTADITNLNSTTLSGYSMVTQNLVVNNEIDADTALINNLVVEFAELGSLNVSVLNLSGISAQQAQFGMVSVWNDGTFNNLSATELDVTDLTTNTLDAQVITTQSVSTDTLSATQWNTNTIFA